MKVLKIGAVWCSGCLVMKPTWAEIEKENPELETVFYDYDDDSEKIEKYNLDDNLPCFIFLDKYGEELERLNGEYSKEELLEKINEYKNK